MDRRTDRPTRQCVVAYPRLITSLTPCALNQYTKCYFGYILSFNYVHRMLLNTSIPHHHQFDIGLLCYLIGSPFLMLLSLLLNDIILSTYVIKRCGVKNSNKVQITRKLTWLHLSRAGRGISLSLTRNPRLNPKLVLDLVSVKPKPTSKQEMGDSVHVVIVETFL